MTILKLKELFFSVVNTNQQLKFNMKHDKEKRRQRTNQFEADRSKISNKSIYFLLHVYDNNIYRLFLTVLYCAPKNFSTRPNPWSFIHACPTLAYFYLQPYPSRIARNGNDARTPSTPSKCGKFPPRPPVATWPRGSNPLDRTSLIATHFFANVQNLVETSERRWLNLIVPMPTQ